MPTYYVDPAAGGNDDGTDWTNAWTTMQRAVDGTNGTQPVAGDIVYCRGTETLSATCDVDGNAGSASGYIRYIGCNAGGSVDGTRYVMDANSAAASCLNIDVAGHLFDNFEFKNATGTGVDNDNASGDFSTFTNCSLNNNGANGYLGNVGANQMIFNRCLFYSNTNHGISITGTATSIIMCAFYGNGDSGIDNSYSGNDTIIGNVFSDNGDNDVQLDLGSASVVVHNVIDGTGSSGETGIFVYSDFGNLILMNRITNMATGIDFSSEVALYGFNVFHGNTANTANATVALPLPLDSDLDTNEDEPDADDGYNATGTADYNLKVDRTYNGDGTDVIGLNVGS